MSTAGSDIFGWMEGEVVLLVERLERDVVVARGWRAEDRLSDIRRWQFTSPSRAAGQVRRLVHEATGDDRLAGTVMDDVLRWLRARVTPEASAWS